MNNTKMSLADWMKSYGFEDDEEAMEFLQMESMNGTCPAMCEEDCTVEPDGECPHGNKSVMLEMGLI